MLRRRYGNRNTGMEAKSHAAVAARKKVVTRNRGVKKLLTTDRVRDRVRGRLLIVLYY